MQRRILCVAAVLALGASRAHAQGPTFTLSALAAARLARTPPVATARAAVAPVLSVAELRELSHDAGVGAIVGTALGVLYGAVAEPHDNLRDLSIIVDGLYGGTIGLLGGAVVYGVRRARGHSADGPAWETRPGRAQGSPPPDTPPAA